MKPNPNPDYTALTALCDKLGLVPYANGNPAAFSILGHHAPVDLSACAVDEISILKTAVKQLSEKLDDAYCEAKERDTLN